MKTFIRWFTRKENILVSVLALVVLAVHLLYIANPPGYNTDDPPTRNYIGDETFYVPEANLFLHGKGLERPEHPPMGKWLIAGGIFFFGDQPVGWRFFPIIFGIISIFLFYFICLRLINQSPGITHPGGPNKPGHWVTRWLQTDTFLPVLATLLFALENMSWVMSHIAMLDVFYVTFMLLGFLLYLKGRYLWCGTAMGLSMLCKPMAFLAVLAILIHFGITHQQGFADVAKKVWQVLRRRSRTQLIKGYQLKICLIPLVTVLVWFALIPVLEFPATHLWANPVSRTINMLNTHLSLNDAQYGSPSGMATNPWVWIINPIGIRYWIIPHYFLQVGYTVWAFIMPSIAYLIYWAIRFRKQSNNFILFALSWFAGVYGLLIILKLATGRLMYHFYFYPAIPAVCMAIAWAAWRLWIISRNGHKSQIIYFAILGIYLIASIASFIIMSPLGENIIKFP